MKDIKICAKINGCPCDFEIPAASVAVLLEVLKPRELNAKQAAKFCGVSEATFRKRNVPKNANGKYSVDELIQRASTIKEHGNNK